MNDLVELNINISTNRFEDWIDRYTKRTLPFIIELTKEKNLGVIAGQTLKNVNRGFRKHEINAMITKPHPTEPGPEAQSFPFPVIEFEIFEPAENQIIVKFLHCDNRLLPYLINLLGEIAHMWPETNDEIEGFLNQFIPEKKSEPSLKVGGEKTDNAGEKEDLSEAKPWEKIPDHHWDRMALEFWWLGYNNREIAKKVNAAPRRVTNRICELRGFFGEKIVPYDNQRKKILREKSRDME